MTKPGFTLLSVLLTMMIIASVMVLTLNRYVEVDNEYMFLMNDLLDEQSDALTNYEERNANDYNVYFNAKGHVNMAQTIHLGRHSVIVHLGNGYLTYE